LLPVKYIEDNLIFNKYGECFAYYEFIPYNYSFLSKEQKEHVYDSFRQLVAQNKEGKIHALQIATESGVKEIQEQSKEEIKRLYQNRAPSSLDIISPGTAASSDIITQGTAASSHIITQSTASLKETALNYVDSQTETLINAMGETQIDYRFFIGFKLFLTDTEMNIKNIAENIQNFFHDFIHTINERAMGEYVMMRNAEIRRYEKVERLLKNKIDNRFRVRRLDPKDFGYIISHIYGLHGVSYTDFQYKYEPKKLKQDTLVKKYDLMKLSHTRIQEGQRSLLMEREEGTIRCACYVIQDVISDIPFPSAEIFYYQQQVFDFPLDTSMNVEIISNKDALSTVRNKKKEVQDVADHALENDGDIRDDVMEALGDIQELEGDLQQTKGSMYKLSYVIRISAKSEEELEMRCNEVRDFYDDLGIKLVRPFGDMIGLLEEFIPSNKRYLDDYVQYVTSSFPASLGFGASQTIGDSVGFYLGYNRDTYKNFYTAPWLAAQGKAGTITNALAVAILGSLGGGKSMLSNYIMYNIVLFGGKVLIIDPKSERGDWKKALPEMADEINIINLTSDPINRGKLDPFVTMDDINDAISSATDVLSFLTGITIKDGEPFTAIQNALTAVAEKEKPGLLLVIEELHAQGTSTAKQIGDHIKSFANVGFSRLLFSDGNAQDSISLNKAMNILQIADLVLPEKDTELKDYTTVEMLSVAMLMVVSAFSLKFIKSNRKIFKAVLIDEAWAMLNAPQGKLLAMKMIRAGRSMNTGVYLSTQNSGDLTGEKMKNNIGMKFAFRSRDIQEIKKTLEFFGLDTEDEDNHAILRGLQNGECLHQDIRGNIAVVKIEVLFDHQFKAWDTRPPMFNDYEDELVEADVYGRMTAKETHTYGSITTEEIDSYGSITTKETDSYGSTITEDADTNWIRITDDVDLYGIKITDEADMYGRRNTDETDVHGSRVTEEGEGT